MPLPILVAVVASDPKKLRSITKGTKTSEPGIAPKYALVSLGRPVGKRIIGISQLEQEHVTLWIALDDQAEKKCVQLHHRNEKRSSYSRGFYDAHLPNPVLKATSKREFEKLVSAVYEAFCATS